MYSGVGDAIGDAIVSAFHVGKYARSVFHARVECEEMVGVGRNVEQTKRGPIIGILTAEGRI